MTHDPRLLIIEKIKAYLESTGVKPGKVTEQSLIYHDLGFRGVDAWEFMQFVLREFDVDLTGFHFKTYFHDEYFGPLDIYRAIFGVYDASKEPLSIGHIVGVCLARNWLPPPTVTTPLPNEPKNSGDTI